MLAPRLLQRYRHNGYGQVTDPEPPDAYWAPKTVGSTTYRLLHPEVLDRYLSVENRGMGDPPSTPLEYAGVSLSLPATHITSPTGKDRSVDFLTGMRAAGYGVLATKVDAATPLRGIALAPGTDLAVATRDLAFVGMATKRDPKALVLFEPMAGWAQPGPSPRLVYVALGLGVLGLAAYLIATRQR